MKPILAITMGDPAGIGAEIVMKALSHRKVYEACIPVVVGDMAVLQDAARFAGAPLCLRPCQEPREARGEFGTVDVIDLGLLQQGGWEYKQVQPECGRAAYAYIERAIGYAINKQVHGVVTAPINKEALNLGGCHYSGHTEIFASLTGAARYAMLLATETLKVIHVTTHVPMRRACDLIQPPRVLEVIQLADESMRLMGMPHPRIGVAGLNAHCSENGLFGTEEATGIIPAIEQAREQGIDVEGPVPPDTIFVKAVAGQYDIVVAMYHDQGHMPVKLSGFKLDLATNRFTAVSGINCTVGLPIIRTSVDHGTAFDKAGEGTANEDSLLDALHMGAKMARNKFGLAKAEV